MGWVQIDTDLFAKEADNPIEVVSKTDLEASVVRYEDSLSAIADSIPHEDKGYETYLNDVRKKEIENLRNRRDKALAILRQING